VNTAEAAVELMEEVKSKVRKEDTVEVAKETATKINVTPEAPEVPEITIEQIREVFVAKNNIKGNTPKLKAILAEFGAGKVTDLQEKDFPAVLKALEEI
jgi:hypothetical protein